MLSSLRRIETPPERSRREVEVSGLAQMTTICITNNDIVK